MIELWIETRHKSLVNVDQLTEVYSRKGQLYVSTGGHSYDLVCEVDRDHGPQSARELVAYIALCRASQRSGVIVANMRGEFSLQQFSPTGSP